MGSGVAVIELRSVDAGSRLGVHSLTFGTGPAQGGVHPAIKRARRALLDAFAPGTDGAPRP